MDGGGVALVGFDDGGFAGVVGGADTDFFADGDDDGTGRAGGAIRARRAGGGGGVVE